VEPTYPRGYLEGIERFNRGEYFEAHEAWEAVWLETGGPLSDFYKGLIQSAVAIYHFRRGNSAGARRLYEGQRRLLAPYAPRTLGLAVGPLLAAMEELFAPLLAAAPGEKVEPDLAKIPRISLDPLPPGPAADAGPRG
jgi:predicted metal-dependent hydrolase